MYGCRSAGFVFHSLEAQVVEILQDMDDEAILRSVGPYLVSRGFNHLRRLIKAGGEQDTVDLEVTGRRSVVELMQTPSVFERQQSVESKNSAKSVRSTYSRDSGRSSTSIITDSPQETSLPIPSLPISPEAPSTNADRLQFAVGLVFCLESEPDCTLQVLRIGSRRGCCSARYSTRGATAIPGVKFEHKEGVLKFEEGEMMKEVCIKLLSDDKWDSTVEFFIDLSQPENCNLHLRLRKCRVKVIDDDCFPTNKYAATLQTDIDSGAVDFPDIIGPNKGQVHWWGLFFEYAKMNFQQPLQRRGSWKCILVDQLKNVLAVAEMFLRMHLVDSVLTPKDPSDPYGDQGVRQFSLLVVVLGLMVPQLVSHFLDYRRNYWKLGGSSRKMLQANLIRKFLAYDTNSRKLVSESFLVSTVTTNVNELVHNGYMQMFPLLRSLGSMITLSGLAYYIYDMLVLPIVVMPFFLLTFSTLRSRRTSHFTTQADLCEKQLITDVTGTAKNFVLLRDFSKRGDAVTRVEKAISVLNAATANSAGVGTNNVHFGAWLGTLLVCAYVFMGGYRLVSGDEAFSFVGVSKIGQFLAVVGIFTKVGDAYEAIYRSIMTIQSAFPALTNIAILLNLPTEDLKLMYYGKGQLQKATETWLQAQKENAAWDQLPTERREHYELRGITTAFDMVAITMKGVKLQFNLPDHEFANQVELNMSVLQGSIVAICGDSGNGKATMLRAIAGVNLPAAGELFVPPHLNVLHVMGEAIFLENRSLYDNLTLGCQTPADSDPVRVRAILQRLNAKAEVIDMATDPEGSPGPWNSAYSAVQRQLLNLARAFIANPDVLAIHIPGGPLGESGTQTFLEAVEEFVENRGLGKDSAEFTIRSPRTVFMTLRVWNDALASKKIRLFRISIKDGVKQTSVGDWTSS